MDGGDLGGAWGDRPSRASGVFSQAPQLLPPPLCQAPLAPVTAEDALPQFHARAAHLARNPRSLSLSGSPLPSMKTVSDRTLSLPMLRPGVEALQMPKARRSSASKSFNGCILAQHPPSHVGGRKPVLKGRATAGPV